MVWKQLAAAAVIAVAVPGIGRASVDYTFFDASTTTQVDLSFSLANQLSPANTPQALMDIGGVYASGFAGASIAYFQGPPGYQPSPQTYSSSDVLSVTFTDFPYGNRANGVPGNGSYTILGDIFDSSPNSVASIGSATITGVPVTPVTPVPEPGSLALLATGAIGLLGLSRRRAVRFS